MAAGSETADGVGVAGVGVSRVLDAFSEDTGLLLHPASKVIKDISMICFLGMRNTFLVVILYQRLRGDIWVINRLQLFFQPKIATKHFIQFLMNHKINLKLHLQKSWNGGASQWGKRTVPTSTIFEFEQNIRKLCLRYPRQLCSCE